MSSTDTSSPVAVAALRSVRLLSKDFAPSVNEVIVGKWNLSLSILNEYCEEE